MSSKMQTLNEEEEYNSWTQTDSTNHHPARELIIAVDHGPKSKHAFDWALLHFCRTGDIVHLLHSVSSLQNKIVYEASQALMEKLSVEALKVSKVSLYQGFSVTDNERALMTHQSLDEVRLHLKVKIVTRIVEGDAGKAICKEAEKLKPIAVVMGTRGRSLMQSVLKGSVSEYCFHNCKAAPVIIVPGIVESGEESVVSLDKK